MTFSVSAPTNNTGALLNNGTEVLSVGSTNNVGIGTDAPARKLHVKSDAILAARIESTNADFSRLTFKNAGTTADPYIGSFNNELRLNSTGSSIVFQDGATEKMRINANGYVTMPAQPIFSVRDLTYTGSSNVNGVGGSVASNVGSFYNSTNGRFTAPINGNYLFYGNVQYYDSGSTTYIELKFLVNDSQFGTGFPSGGSGIYNNHLNVSGTVIIPLNANDYVNIRASYGSRNLQNYFGGYLIG